MNMVLNPLLKLGKEAFEFEKNILNPKSKAFKIGGTKCKLSLEEPPNKLWECRKQVIFKGKNHTTWVIYVWSKVVCLFCFDCPYEIHWTGMLQITFLVSLESSRRGGVHWLGFMALFWTHGAKFLEYWMVFSLKIKLNRSWKLRGIEMCLWCCWKDLDEQDLMEFIW